MKKELEAKLKKKYPKLFSQTDLPKTLTCMSYGCDFNDGWYSIIEKLCENLTKVDIHKAVSFSQVKEKFGTLRVYFDLDEDKDQRTDLHEIQTIIDKAEIKSATTCEWCGKPGQRRKGSWIRTLCQECEDNREKRYKAEIKIK